LPQIQEQVTGVLSLKKQLTIFEILFGLFVFFLPAILLAGTNKYYDLDVDNIHLDAATISTTNTNGDLTVSPDGTGKLIYSPGTVSTVPYLDGSKKLTSSAVTPTELGYLSGVTSGIQSQLNLKSPIASPTFTGTVTTPAFNLSGQTASTVPYLDVSKNLVSSSVTPTELGYLSGVTSALQTQIAAKAPSASPTLSGSVTLSGLTATTVPYLDGSKVLTSSAVTPTELGYLSGVTSAIQTQLGTKAPSASPTFTGTTTFSSLTATTVPYLDGSKVLTSSSVTPTELGYVSGVTSAIQTQIGTKAPSASPTFTGTTTFSGLTASTVPYLDASKVLTSSSVTPTELGYVSGVTSAIQTQLGLKAPLASPSFTGTAGINDSSNTAGLFVKSSATNVTSLVVKAVVSQTADLINVLDSSGAAQFMFDSGGNFKMFHNVATPEARFDIRPSVSLTSASSGSAVRYSMFVGQATALAAGVGGGIAIGGPQTSSTDLTEYGYIWVTKDNATSGDVDTAIHIASRRNSDGKAQRGLDIDHGGNSTFAGTVFGTNHINGFTSTATAAGTTTLTVASNRLQFFTGATTQTLVMPVATTLVNGQQWEVHNNSSGNVTVQSSGTNTICTPTTGQIALLTMINTSGGTGTASWDCKTW
jgi:hypothetical protein